MIKDLFDLLKSPLGLFAAVGLIATPGGRDLARKATKFIVRTAVEAGESVKEIYNEVKEEEDEAILSNGGRKARITTKAKSES
jgi:predicted transcriptional regulator